MRAPLQIGTAEMEYRDGMHGLVTWGLAVVITALLALGAAALAAPAVPPSGGTAGAVQSVAGENIIASELDELFRSDRSDHDLQNRQYRRAEAARILLKASSHNGVSNVDRRYLSAITASVTGLSVEDADARVGHEIAAARDELRRARVAAVLQAFFIGAALLVGAAVAWFCAAEGGREREANILPDFAKLPASGRR
jgi:amino acid transporter